MTREREILERGYTMIWREDRLVDAVAGLDADFEWVTPDIPDVPVRRGPEAVLDFFRDWMDRFEGLHVDWELHDTPDGRVLALIRMHGTGRSSGVPAEMRFAQLWTFRDGRATRMVSYGDVDEARRAAGLS